MVWLKCPLLNMSDEKKEIQDTPVEETEVGNKEFEQITDAITSKQSIPSESEDRSDYGQDSNNNNLEKMILSTGIRVGTPVKTKYMMPFIVRANPEGLYILDISKTLSRIDVAAKFIGRASISKVAVTSAREYGKTPVEKLCELTGATSILGRFMPGTF